MERNSTGTLLISFSRTDIRGRLGGGWGGLEVGGGARKVAALRVASLDGLGVTPSIKSSFHPFWAARNRLTRKTGCQSYRLSSFVPRINQGHTCQGA